MPQREHARFCSARCRVTWNRENWNRASRERQQWGSESWERDAEDSPAPEASALGWAIVAMRETTQRLGKVRASSRAQAFAVIGEAVWWVTIVDATLVRYHPEDYEAVLMGLSARQRRVTEATFAGLRFVRNRMGYHADHADFIQPQTDDEGSDAPLTEWAWRSLPVPTVDSMPPRSRQWELSRYRAYQDRLARRMVGETFARAAAFLDLAAEAAGDGKLAGDKDGESGDSEFRACGQ